MKTYTIQELKDIVCKKIDSGDYELDEKGQVIFYTGVFEWEQKTGTEFRSEPSFADEQD
jgi:hypothetical protein